MTAVALTGKLRLELEKTNATFSRWADCQRERLHSTESAYDVAIDECRYTLSALREHEAQIEELREQNANIKRQQAEDVKLIAEELAELRLKRDALQPELEQVTEEEQQQTSSLEAIHSELEAMRRRMERSLNDLTHGLHLYAALGLKFQKAEGDCMKFIFTHIDHARPSKEFFFLLFVGNDDKYQLIKTSPVLDQGYCAKLLEQFNKDNDIGRFVLQMRNTFKRLVC